MSLKELRRKYADFEYHKRDIRNIREMASEDAPEGTFKGNNADYADNARKILKIGIPQNSDRGEVPISRGLPSMVGCSKDVEAIADRVAAWLDMLVDRWRVSEDEAVGIGLLIWYRHGGEAVWYRRPSVVLDDRFLPSRWRGERAAFAGLAAAKFPAGVTCVRDDLQGRPFWMPTMRAGELLERELAKDRKAGRIAA